MPSINPRDLTLSIPRKPHWQLPEGVSRATWDYIQAAHIATEYDDYFSNSALMRLDLQVVGDHLPPIVADPAPQIADLGCGTGRVARALLPLGYRMLNVDLSQAMLREVAAKTPAAFRERSQCICANLVQLDSVLEPQSVDMAVCLFSSLGMIQNRHHRRRFLTAVNRVLKPHAPFVVHVHNRYSSLTDPGGPSWLLQSWLKSCTNKYWEFGDRVYAYRRLPQMFLHIYSRRELIADLRAAQFEDIRVLAISKHGDRLMHDRTPFSSLRAGGFFAVC